MSWWDKFREGLQDELSNTDRRVAGEVERFIEDASASGATTDKDQQARWDAYVAGLPPAERAQVVAKMEAERAQLEAILRESGYKGDLENMTFLELARLAVDRGLLDMQGDGHLPTASALAAAAAATEVGGNWSLNPLTGEIVIYRGDKGDIVHETIPGGQEARPAEIVQAEVFGGSVRGGARPTREQIAEAIKIQENNPGSSLSPGANGSLEVTRKDGTVITIPNDPLQQGREDVEANAGDIGGMAAALDGAARRTIDNLADGIADAFERAKPSFGGSAAAGMGGSGSSTPTGMTGSTPPKTPESSGGSTGYRPPSNQGSGDPSLDVDEFDASAVRKPASSSSAGSSSNPPAQPASTEPTEVVKRSNEEPSEPDNEDGWAPSNKTPPTDATTNDTGDDGAAEQPQPDSDGDGIPDDEDPDTDVLEYTPAPGDEGRRDWDEEDLERMAEAAAAMGQRYDRPEIKLPQYDPEFAARMQARKLGMIGNPGDPDNDNAVPTGGLPDQKIPLPDPDDDTPGHDTSGVDTGAEDPMLNPPQETLDPSILDEDPIEELPLQETAVATIDPALSAPLETSVQADVNIEYTPNLPGYHYAIGDPVPTTPPAEDEPIAARTDARLGGQLSLPTSFKLPTRDATEDDDADGG